MGILILKIRHLIFHRRLYYLAITVLSKMVSFYLFMFQIHSFLAIQIWCLARLLPLMIGEHIPLNNANWNNFTLLVTIIDYIFAPLTSDEISSYVAMLLKEHHERFTELYPNSPIIPKMHYMIHLPEWMRRHVS